MYCARKYAVLNSGPLHTRFDVEKLCCCNSVYFCVAVIV